MKGWPFLAASAAALLFLAASAAALLPAPAWADSYLVTFGWTDATAYKTGDAPVYLAKYKIANGAEVPINALATPGGSVTVTATPGQTIQVAGQNTNKGLLSAWSAYVTATFPVSATQPGAPTGMTVTVSRTGP